MPLTPEELEERLLVLEKRNRRLERRLLHSGRAFTNNLLAQTTDLDDIGSIKTHLDFEEPPLTPTVPPTGVSRLYAPKGGGFMPVLLDEVTLGAAAQVLASFTNIPAGFRNLRLVYNGGSNTSADAAQNIIMRFNGGTGANYHYQIFIDGASAQGLGATFIPVGIINGAQVNDPTWGVIDIPSYTNTSFAKSIVFQSGHWLIGDVRYVQGMGSWATTGTAIDRIDILTKNAATKFNTGSVAYLYGY